VSLLAPATIGPVTREHFMRWMESIDDLASPVHYDDDHARRQGHPSVFAPGMLQAAALADYAIAHFSPAAVRRCRMRFTGLVWPGDVLTCSGAVTDTRDGEVDVELERARDDGEVVVRGWMTFGES
jgi:acyl dehydratase